MTGLIIKLIVCPLAVLLSMVIFPLASNLSRLYSSYLCTYTYDGSITMLKRGTFWHSTVMDLVAATAIVYVVSRFFLDTEVTLFGALLTHLV